VLVETLDGAALAGRVAPLEQEHEALTGFDCPFLNLQQFGLKPRLLGLVRCARQFVTIRVAIRFEEPANLLMRQRGGIGHPAILGGRGFQAGRLGWLRLPWCGKIRSSCEAAMASFMGTILSEIEHTKGTTPPETCL
jgi:hypothetical protein